MTDTFLWPNMRASDPLSLPGRLPITSLLIHGVHGAPWHWNHKQQWWTSPGHPRTFATFAALYAAHGPLTWTGRAINP